MKLKNFFLSIPVLVICFSAPLLVSQVANNTAIVGTVRDPDGKLIPNAKVVAVNQGTKVQYPANTDNRGDYQIQFVAPGSYNVTVNGAGFSQIVKTGVVVVVNQPARADFELVVGSEAASITITASTPPLQTDDASLGETFDSKSVQDLPLMGHNALDIATTASNVTTGVNTSYTNVPPGEDFIGAGQREIQNSISLDGVSIMNNLLSAAPARPSSDMISEVQMQSGNYSAQYGSYLGLHVNLVSKYGTNDLHGAAYDYIQNTALNAHNYTDAPGAAKAVQHYNQYGFTLGGPVDIPHLYNGRNRTFFFGSWERLRQIQESPDTGETTLTAAERNGDFSARYQGFDGSGNCINLCLHDPFTGDYYPNNIIPASDLNTAAAQISKKLQAYMVLPNQPGSTASFGTEQNLSGNNPSSLVITQTLDRVDENIGDKVRLFFRYHWQDISFFTGTLFPTNSTSGPTNSRNYAFGYTHIITQKLINDFHIGLNTIVSNNLDYFYANGPSNAGTQLGIPGFTSDTQYGNPGIPTINIDGVLGLGNGSANWFQDDRTVDGYDQVSYQVGKHNLMFGAELRRLTLGRQAANDPRGVFNFSANSNNDSTSTGFAAADFVLGLAQSSNTPIFPLKSGIGEWRDGFFVLDNWQILSRLTLNYGIRYELPTVPYSLNGYARILNANETAIIPASSAADAASFTPAVGFKFINPTHMDWAPRVGFAYRPSDHNTIRGGFGIYYNANQLNTYTLTAQNYPFANTAEYDTDPSNPVSLSNPTPGAASLTPVTGVPGTYGSAITMGPDLPTQRLYQWNLSVGQDLWHNAALELQYLGSHALHLDRNFFDNTPTPGPGTINSRRPNQLFGKIRRIQNDAYSHYNGLTTILRQRSFHGLSALLSYTWSHDLDVTDDSNGTGNTMNNYNIAQDYGNSGWDIRHRFVGSATYALPTLANHGFLVRETAGGWQLNTIVTLQTGTPFNLLVDNDPANISEPRNTVQRPNILAPLQEMHCTTQNIIRGTTCLDIAHLAIPAQYTFGNAARNMYHGPGQENVNFSVFKNVPIYNRLQLQIRAEVANLFNHPNPNGPNSEIDSPSFVGNNPASDPTLGTVTNVSSSPRQIQLAGKIIF
ncbi:carboxypeptidase regulatory-like domain-containing protein [Terriglobus saanensis]|uniref:carboxypeptidase regulatory-like domain-containing protein n=1 Tax=Terriglobus saanensis TaxID=870903 RepID=UPI001FE14D86|nr:carboxypeptidase regulatory-like domain-containing protein [Terriglobus saanensis]